MPHLPPVPPIRQTQLPREALKELVSSLTVTDWTPTGWSVVWDIESLPFEGLRNGTLGAYVELSISAYRSIGEDDYRQVFDPTTNALLSVYYGLRAFTLTIDARSFDYDVPAWDVLESIRLRMNNRRSATANVYLRENNLAWVRTHPTVSLNYAEKGDVDNRMIWRQTMDIEFTWLSAAQVVDDPGNYLETVGASELGQPAGSNDIPGTIYDPAGNPVT